MLHSAHSSEQVDVCAVCWRWRRRYSEVAPVKLLDLIDSEYAASAVNQFETMFVPGILQTEEYASAVLQAFYDAKSGDERVAALVELRTKRREAP